MVKGGGRYQVRQIEAVAQRVRLPVREQRSDVDLEPRSILEPVQLLISCIRTGSRVEE